MNELKLTGKLVGAQELLNELFSDGCRPSVRWLPPSRGRYGGTGRQTKARAGWEWLATQKTTTSPQYAGAQRLPYRTAMNHLCKSSMNWPWMGAVGPKSERNRKAGLEGKPIAP